MAPSKFFSTVNGNPSVSWDCVRKDIGQQIFGKKFSTVPVLHEAKNFDMLCVYKKESRRKSLLRSCVDRPTYRMIGWLRDFIVASHCNRKRLEELIPRSVSTDIGPVYQFSNQETYEGLLKEVIVRIFDVYRQVSDFKKMKTGDIILDTNHAELIGLKKVYVLCEVYLCHRFYLYTRLGRREIIDNQADDRFPLGFRSIKFRLQSDGSLKRLGYAESRRGPNSASWNQCGIHNLHIKNLPLLPTLTLVSSQSKHRRQVMHEGYRRNSFLRRLSLKSMQNSPYRLDDPDCDLIRDHDQLNSRAHSTTGVHLRMKKVHHIP